ncbi:MAG: sigma-70 family RNA polymerase sigma factor [bacterium]|nr:sigma-70 family RNA polymerase sigma factor [bacterium]
MDNKCCFLLQELPECLTDEQIKTYFYRYKVLGDEDARNIIINHNIKLVINIVYNSFVNSSFDLEDLVSIGIIGLIKAVDNFCIEKNYKFSTYAFVCIKNEITALFRSEKQKSNSVSFDWKMNERYYSFVDLGMDVVYNYEIKVLGEEVRKILSYLDEDQRKMVELYFGMDDGKCYTHREIGAIFNLSRPYITKKLKKIMCILKEHALNNKALDTDFVRTKSL